MIELAQHIEKLLLDNDCVIVPGLGGFVAHHTPSVRVEEENLFLPPMRTIGLNPQLKMNDGLLVQSYMEVYNTSFSDATRKVEHQVEDLVRHLHEEGKADLPNVGELRCSIRGTYEFEPYDDKITTPYLYGLASFEMKTLAPVRTSFREKRTPDYLLPDMSGAVLPAGEYSFDYTVTLLRTDALENEEKTITLELHENEYFTLSLTEMAQTADTASTVNFSIVFSDMFTSAPAAWEENVLGEFSQAKFDLICKVLSIDPDDFNDAAVMTLPKQMYILEEITSYIDEETAKKNAGQAFDEDIIDPATGDPIKFE